MSPAPARGGKQFLGLSPKVWIGVLALGVVVFLYIRHKNKSTTAADPAVDPSQVVSAADTASLAAGLGGTPAGDTGGFDTSWLASLFQQQEQSLEEFIANSGLITGSGISGAGGSGATGTVPAAAAPQTVGAPIVVNPTAPASAQEPAATDISNLATSFYPPDSNAAVGGSSPLYAYNGGSLVAESPIAGGAFSIDRPASEGYESLGVHPSDPITFTPSPMGTPTTAPEVFSAHGTRSIAA